MTEMAAYEDNISMEENNAFDDFMEDNTEKGEDNTALSSEVESNRSEMMTTSPNDTPSEVEGEDTADLPVNKSVGDGIDNGGFEHEEKKEENLRTPAPVKSSTDNGVSHPGHSDDPSLACGLGSCRPDILQKCRNMGCFTVMYSLTGIMTSALNLYMSSQITTLEKHFNLSSSMSGFILACNDLGYLSTTLFLSYYTRRVHIPRFLGWSTVLYGVAAIFCTIGFFGTRDQLLSSNALSVNRSAEKNSSGAQMCTKVGSSVNATCEEILLRANAAFEISEEWRKAAIFIFALGMILQGVAKSPRQPFIATYIDDNVPKTKTSMYLGVTIGLSIFGPALAFLLGGVFSKIYITLEERDPRWLGAWWLGFLVFGGCSLVVAIPLMCFPPRMKKTEGGDCVKHKEAKSQSEGLKSLQELKGFVKAVFRLICNPVYVCLTISTSINLLSISGMMAFMPKYLETQFSVPASQANMMLGAINVFAACIGTMIGGWLVSRFKLSPVTCLKITIVSMVIATVLMALGIITGCDQPDIVMETRSNNSCVQECNCDQQNYFPVCGGDGRNYFSPCHAGCTSTDVSMGFGNCKCQSTNQTQTARGGLCDPDCSNLYVYAALCFLGSLIGTISLMPFFIVMIRCVSERDKPLAIGFGAFCGTLIGWFPGPVIFGIVVDTTCLIWKTTCATVGACLLYHIVQFRIRLHALVIGIRVVTIVLLVIALLIVSCSKKPFFQQAEDIAIDVKSHDSSMDVARNQKKVMDIKETTTETYI